MIIYVLLFAQVLLIGLKLDESLDWKWSIIFAPAALAILYKILQYFVIKALKARSHWLIKLISWSKR